MDRGQDSFLELPDEIPYKKITFFKIVSVLYNNNSFTIKLDRKCQSLPEQKQYTIVRKISDFQWLLNQLQKQNPHLAVLPSMVESTQSFLQSITNRLSDHSKMEMKRWSNQYFSIKMVERFLGILSQVTINNLYIMPGFVKSSLFTFLDQNYELYKLETYQQNYQQKISSKDNNSGGGLSTISSFAQTLGHGGMKILGMFNVLKKQSTSEHLQSQLKGFSEIQGEIRQFNKQIEGIQKNLQILIQNFLNEKGLKQRYNDIYGIYLRSSGYHKIIIKILNEITSISQKFESIKKKQEDNQLLKQQLRLYQKFLAAELTQIRKQFSSIVEELYRKCYQDQIYLKLQDLYPIKPVIK